MKALSDQVGGVAAMSEILDKDQNQIRHLIGKKPTRGIGHKIAKEVEQAFNKPAGWLDIDHSRAVSEDHETRAMLKEIMEYIESVHDDLTPQEKAFLIYDMLEEHSGKDIDPPILREFIDFWVSIEKRRTTS